MINSRKTERSEIFRRFLIVSGRTLLGLALGVVLSMVSLAIAWGLFIFSGASSFNIWLVMTMAGAGIGAGLGAYVAWLKLDRMQWTSMAFTALLAVAGGVIGGLAGYEYGARREIECCAEPTTGPLTYTAFGSSLLANAAMYLIAAGNAAVGKFRAGKGSAVPR